MSNRRGNRRVPVSPFYTFAIIWLLMSGLLPIYSIMGILSTLGLCIGGAFLAGRISASREESREKNRLSRGYPMRSSVSCPSRSFFL